MARPNPLRRIMELELPSITYQRRKQFRPADQDVAYAYKIINRHIFDNSLKMPPIEQGVLRKAWGICEWHNQPENGSWVKIRLMDKWFCPQWFMNTLAHEMVHQYQWEIYRWEHLDYYGRPMYEFSGGHGASFYMWRERFKHYGLNLKIYHSQKRWFRHQDFTKC